MCRYKPTNVLHSQYTCLLSYFSSLRHVEAQQFVFLYWTSVLNRFIWNSKVMLNIYRRWSSRVVAMLFFFQGLCFILEIIKKCIVCIHRAWLTKLRAWALARLGKSESSPVCWLIYILKKNLQNVKNLQVKIWKYNHSLLSVCFYHFINKLYILET